VLRRGADRHDPRQNRGRGEAFAPLPGGSVFNTAVALGRLGAPTGFLCGLSRDLFGKRLEAALAQAGVDTAPCPRNDRPTTLAFVTLVDGQARYAFYDENTAMRMVTAADMPALPDAVEAVFCGGISLAVEPCGGAYEAQFSTAAAAGRLTMIDPNIRPGFIADEAAYRARLDRMMGQADIVKLSDEDMGWLFPGIGEGEVANRLLSAGETSLLLVTRGAKGATCHARGGLRVDRPAPVIQVVDTVGAGDTFNAGFLAGLARAGALGRESLATLDAEGLGTCLSLAVTAAAVTASRQGADPPWASELE
jgi:fructokinase